MASNRNAKFPRLCFTWFIGKPVATTPSRGICGHTILVRRPGSRTKTIQRPPPTGERRARRSAVSGRRSAVGGQRSAVSGQRSAVSKSMCLQGNLDSETED